MKLSILSIFTISLMLAAAIIISAEILMTPFEAAVSDFAGQTTGIRRILR